VPLGGKTGPHGLSGGPPCFYGLAKPDPWWSISTSFRSGNCSVGCGTAPCIGGAGNTSLPKLHLRGMAGGSGKAFLVVLALDAAGCNGSGGRTPDEDAPPSVRAFLLRRASRAPRVRRGLLPIYTRHGRWQPCIGLKRLASFWAALPNSSGKDRRPSSGITTFFGLRTLGQIRLVLTDLKPDFATKKARRETIRPPAGRLNRNAPPPSQNGF